MTTTTHQITGIDGDERHTSITCACGWVMTRGSTEDAQAAYQDHYRDIATSAIGHVPRRTEMVTVSLTDDETTDTIRACAVATWSSPGTTRSIDIEAYRNHCRSVITSAIGRVPSDYRSELFAAFIAGFGASSQGFNGEYPFADESRGIAEAITEDETVRQAFEQFQEKLASATGRVGRVPSDTPTISRQDTIVSALLSRRRDQGQTITTHLERVAETLAHAMINAIDFEADREDHQ